MGAQSLQKTRHETAFEYFMRESIKAINLLPDAVEWPFRTESPCHGIHALWKDSFIHNGLEYSEYHKTLRRLHGLGLLLVCYSVFLQGDHEIERSAGNYEIRTIPIIYFLIPRGEQSDRFIHQLESNTELNVCVWDAKDQFTAGPSDELSKKNVKGKNFEWRIERSWDGEDPSWDCPLVEPFEYDPEEDSRVKEFLENDNPYFCVVGMNINSNDYRENDPCLFLKKIKDFDLVEHIEQAKKLSEDGLAGAYTQMNHEKVKELSGLPKEKEAQRLSQDGLAGAYTQLNDKKVEELSWLPSKEEAKKSSEDGLAGAYTQMNHEKVKELSGLSKEKKAQRLSQDGLAGAHEEVNHEKDDCGNYRKSSEELSGLPSKGEAQRLSQDGLAGAYTQLNDKKVEELSGLPSKGEAQRLSQDGLAGAYKQMNHNDHYPTPFEELSGLQNKIEAKKRHKVSR